MSLISAVLILAATHECYAGDADQYGPPTTTTTTTAAAPTTTTTTAYVAPIFTPRPNKVPHTFSTTPAPGYVGNFHTTQTQWWDNKDVKKGLIGGAAAAGLATFGGLGIAAIVQANQKTTTPYVPPPTYPPTTSYITTVSYMILNRAVAREQPTEESSMSPVLLGILVLLGLLACCGTIAFCAYMCSKRKGRTTKKRPAPVDPQYYPEEEEQPLVAPAAPPAPPPQAPPAPPPVQMAPPYQMAPPPQMATPSYTTLPQAPPVPLAQYQYTDHRLV